MGKRSFRKRGERRGVKARRQKAAWYEWCFWGSQTEWQGRRHGPVIWAVDHLQKLELWHAMWGRGSLMHFK